MGYPNRKDYSLIPDLVMVDCHQCELFWVQTREQALANPTAPMKCPRCGAFYVLPCHRPDQPIFVGANDGHQ